MFEGYVGIHLWDGQQTDDLLLSGLLVFLMVFAFMLHFYPHQFIKLLKDSFSMKRRQSLFDKPVNESRIFQYFMLVQSIVMCGYILFLFLLRYGYSTAEDIYSILYEASCYTALLAAFFMAKQCLYFILGMVFGDSEKYRWWRNGYNAIIGIWGVTLYIPAIWLILIGIEYKIPIIMFVSLYVFCRFAIIHKIIRIFYTKNKGFFYVSLYLCAQEILPLLFLYKGVMYMYNFID